MKNLSKPLFFRNLLVVTLVGIGLFLSCKKDNPPTTPSKDVNLKKGLLLYLPFDGNFADSSGNGNLTYPTADAALTYDEHGYANSAFNGGGNGERVKVVNNGSIKFDTAFSTSYNVMQRDISRWQGFLSMVDPVNGYAPTFISGTNIIGTNNFNFAVNDSTAGCDNTGYLKPNGVNDTTSFTPQPESWYNIICTYHKGTIWVYVNGKLISTKTGTGTRALLCPASKVIIGGWWDNDPISLNGKLDEVRIYNRVLSADEIAELSKDFQN
ncbi:LamG domain-containing protein [Flavitalea flava]